MESIVLIGFMGAGKTTIGQSLANKLKMPHLDLDTALIEKIGRSIPDYFEKYGEADFPRTGNPTFKGAVKKYSRPFNWGRDCCRTRKS